MSETPAETVADDEGDVTPIGAGIDAGKLDEVLVRDDGGQPTVESPGYESEGELASGRVSSVQEFPTADLNEPGAALAEPVPVGTGAPAEPQPEPVATEPVEPEGGTFGGTFGEPTTTEPVVTEPVVTEPVEPESGAGPESEPAL